MNVVKKNWQRGFTLIELLAVVTIIVLLAVTLVPSVAKFLTSGAEASAQNMLTGTIMTARAHAIKTRNYTALHVQQVNNPNVAAAGTFYAAIFEHQPQTTTGSGDYVFHLVSDYQPRAFPGGVAFGKLNESNANPGFVDTDGNFRNLTNANLEAFTNFTILFAKDGSVVKYIEGKRSPVFITEDIIKNGANLRDGPGSVNPYSAGAARDEALDKLVWGPITARPNQRWFWNADLVNKQTGGFWTGEPGTIALIRFNYKALQEVPENDEARNDYLRQNGKILALNLMTGQISD